MFYSQIPKKFLDKYSKSFKIDLKFFSASLTDKSEQDTRFMKCKIVSEFIQKDKTIGTIKAPENYILDTLSMKWGKIPDYGGILFCSLGKDRIVAFSGSESHLIGEKNPQVAPYKLRYRMKYRESPILSVFGQFSRLWTKYDTPNNEYIIKELKRIVKIHKFPSQKLEFLARIQIQEKDRKTGKQLIFGSPIYVALAD